MEAIKRETLDMSSRAIQYRVLLRDVETNRALYENILKSLKETTTIENVPATNIRIVYPAAVPTAPVSPQKSRILMIGATLGLFFGVGLALVLENLDTTLKSPEETERRLGLPNLAVIPHLQVNSDHSGSDGIPAMLVQSRDQPMAAEAYRSLRTSIQFSTPGHSPRTILVTSSLPLEGKSMTAVNLAAVMAKAEPRILLVDADLRRPTLHARFGVSKEPGLTNFLVGEIEDIPASPTSITNLFLVPCGHISPNPSELLGSQRMRDFLARASEQFGRVIIDSPPMLSVTDPAILGAQAEGVLLVIKSETVPRKAAMEARDQLTAVNAHLLGTLLNDISFKRDGYYYRHYYRYRQYYKPEEAGSTGKDESSPIHASGVWSRIKQTVKNGPTLGKS
jgi:succinoglycan biosynthesis transport protein ExoP